MPKAMMAMMLKLTFSQLNFPESGSILQRLFHSTMTNKSIMIKIS